MKNTLLFILLFTTQITFGQTENRMTVSGTKCSMIPPEGFVAASTFSGFQQVASGASIMINEIPAPYQSIIEGFTKEAMKAKGMTLVRKETIDFNNSTATLMNVTQPANGTTYIKQMLVFGDEKVTVLVNGIYPESAKNLESSMKEALLSTVYTAEQNENPLDAATFTVDVEGTDLKLVKYMSGSLLYSVDGNMPTETPTLIVGNSIAKVSPENRQKYAEERLRKLPRGESTLIKETNEITIDSLNGVEFIAEGIDKNENKIFIYMVMLYNESGDYYIIVGQAKDDREKYGETFKKIAKTFKRK